MDGLHELAPDQRTAETAGIGNAARRYVDRDMPLRHEVEVDRGAVGEERDDGLGAIEGRPGDAFEDRAGEIADPAAQDRRRGLRAVVPSEVGGAHGCVELHPKAYPKLLRFKTCLRHLKRPTCPTKAPIYMEKSEIIRWETCRMNPTKDAVVTIDE